MTPHLTSLVAIEIFDGPVAGLARGDRGDSWTFRAVAWDDERNIRIFLLNALPADVTEEIVALLGRFEPPRWPAWWVRTPIAESEWDRIQLLLAQRGPPGFVAATGDLLATAETAWLRLEAPRDLEAVEVLLREPEETGARFEVWMKLLRRLEDHNADRHP